MRYWIFLWVAQGFAAFNLTWGTPALNLDTNPPLGDTDSHAHIAIDKMGNAVATWSRTIGRSASEDIWAAVYNHSLRVWTGAVKISGGGSAENAQVAIDEEGNALIVWEEGFPTQILYRTLSKDGVWTPDLEAPPSQVLQSKNTQTFGQIKVDAEGNALAIWMEYYQGNEHIHSAKYSPNSGWTNLEIISSADKNATLVPAKALDLNSLGDGIAVWEESDGNTSSIHGVTYSNGAWGIPYTLSEEGKHATSPAAKIDHYKRAVIVWSQENSIYSQTIRNHILFPKSLILSDPNYMATRPDVGMDAEGNAVVVFERYNALHKFIAGSSLPKGASSWTPPIDISGPSPSGAEVAGYPVFSLNSIGDGVVIWKEFTGSNVVIQGAGYSLGTWSFTKTLSSLTSDSGAATPTYDISVVLNDSGNILAIWPEDPTGRGTLQIKSTAGVGLANAAPLPPSPNTFLDGIATGTQILHKFPAHADLINIISWSAAGDVDHFNVYRDHLAALIGTTKEPKYEDHQRPPKEKSIYLVTCVDSSGQESAPITIVVHPR